MRWTVHGERLVYDSPWVRLALTDVEIPGMADGSGASDMTSKLMSCMDIGG
jgi:hypothetical protein